MENVGSEEEKKQQFISGFSKMSKQEKLDWIVKNNLEGDASKQEMISSFWHQNESVQKVLDDFSENTISNFPFPYGILPQLVINNKLYNVPMVIEESSVVAAASNAAKFWSTRGGIHAQVIDTQKIGQVHFLWKGQDSSKLDQFFESRKPYLLDYVAPLLSNMVERGGGITSLRLVNKTQDMEDYFQLFATFETCDAMGANFINSVLESLAKRLVQEAMVWEDFDDEEKEIFVIMSILSNYTPNCLVKVWVECPIAKLHDDHHAMDPEVFASKIKLACDVASADVHRATTHNKGIFNGVDAVILATGNDFRAAEACGHTYACRNGRYQGLTRVSIKGDQFKFELSLPLALGTVGGLTSLHPLAAVSLDILGRPSAKELMMVAASVGLVQNFAALRSLVTSGIQKGHMKMHLINILNNLNAKNEELALAREFFTDKVVSYKAARDFLETLRNGQ